jgi:uncharacterized membrane protein YfcA
MKNGMNKVPKKLFPYLCCGLTGFGAGLLNGLLGAAGGILLVIALPRLTPPASLYPPDCPLGRYHERRDILATAMTVMLPISVVSGAFYWLGGIRPSLTLLLSLILPAAAGGFVGAKLLTVIPNHLLKKFFAAVVVVAGIRMLFG